VIVIVIVIVIVGDAATLIVIPTAPPSCLSVQALGKLFTEFLGPAGNFTCIALLDGTEGRIPNRPVNEPFVQ